MIFTITFTRTETGSFTVEAESETEAWDMADEFLGNSPLIDFNAKERLRNQHIAPQTEVQEAEVLDVTRTEAPCTF